MNSILSFIKTFGPFMLKGLATTLFLWLCCSLISLVMGFLWGSIRCRQFRVPFISPAIDGFTFILRAIPFYVQLLLAYFVLPQILGINLSGTQAAILSLGLCSAAYMSQIVRGSINAIPVGQWEAALVLGYTSFQTVLFIILPQCLRIAMPMVISELDQLLKSTSIVSTIGVLELTRTGMNIIAREMNPVPVYCAIAFLYVLMSLILLFLSRFIEKRVYYGNSK